MMRLVLLILLSAGLHALAFPPWDVIAVAWVALVPLLYVLRKLRPLTAVLAGLLWGHVTHWAVAYWVPQAVSDYYGQAPWFGVAFVLATSPLFWCGYFAAFAGGACLLLRRYQGVTCALLVACLWVACELARARLLAGAPWLLLGYSQLANVPLIQAAEIAGVYLLSFAVAFVNAAGCEILQPGPAARRLRIGMATAVLPLGLYAYGQYQLAMPAQETFLVPVAAMQGNSVAEARWEPAAPRTAFDEYLRLSVQAGLEHHPQLMVWPQAALAMFVAHDPEFHEPVARLLQANEADLIVGSAHYVEDDPAQPGFFNSALYVTGEGQFAGRVDQVHFLPLVDYFPWGSGEFMRRRFERAPSFTPGKEGVLLHTRFGKVAVAFGGEASFPEIVRSRMARGAGLLVILANDTWLGATAGAPQHLAMARLRAVENRTWIIRAAATGVSALIDPFGRLHGVVPSSTTATVNGAVRFGPTPTVYQQVGDLFAYSCALTAVAAVLLATRRTDLS